MTETKFTPGPWLSKSEDNGDEIKITSANDDVNVIAGCGCCGSPYTDNVHNISLITAAPELYSIAEIVARLPIRDHLPDDVPVVGVDGVYITQGDVKKARTSLSKVRGETQ